MIFQRREFDFIHSFDDNFKIETRTYFNNFKAARRIEK